MCCHKQAYWCGFPGTYFTWSRCQNTCGSFTCRAVILSCFNGISPSPIYNLFPPSCCVAITTSRMSKVMINVLPPHSECNVMRIHPRSYQTLLPSVTCLFVAKKTFVRGKCQAELQNTARDFGRRMCFITAEAKEVHPERKRKLPRVT